MPVTLFGGARSCRTAARNTTSRLAEVAAPRDDNRGAPFRDLPLYDADLEGSTGFSVAVTALADAIRGADGVIGGCAAKFDATSGALTDATTRDIVKQQLAAFAAFVERQGVKNRRS